MGTQRVRVSPYWPPFQAWLSAMNALGYHHELVWLNSMHAHVFGPGAPQSRDRLYIVFWKEGATKPDFEWLNRPLAQCLSCGPVRALKVWKKPAFQWGRYRAQYTFRCPNTRCRRTIEPHYRPASDIIDWTLRGTRIGDRDRPLAHKTMARIQAGMDKYWSPLLVPVEGREGKRSAPVSGPTRTMTTRNETGLAVPCGGTWREHAASLADPLSTRTTRETDGLALHPFIAELRGGGSKHRPVTDPLCTVTASGNHHGLVTSVQTHALLMRNNTARGHQGQMSTPVAEPIRTITTAGHQSLLSGFTLDIGDVWFRMLEPREIIAAMDFPTDYIVMGNRREQVRMAGNAVTPPCCP